jgi:hypothetical protein
MDLQDLGVEFLILLGTPLFILLLLALGRTRFTKILDTWDAYAAEHDLIPLRESFTVNYGSMVGEQNFDVPGLRGMINGYDVAALLSAITKQTRTERYGYRVRIRVHLHRVHPRVILLHRRKLDPVAMKALPARIKTNDRPFDRYFKVYTDAPVDLMTVGASDLLAYLMRHFQTASFEIDGEILLFTGRPKRQRIQPEHLHAMMREFAEHAAWVDTWVRSVI